MLSFGKSPDQMLSPNCQSAVSGTCHDAGNMLAPGVVLLVEKGDWVLSSGGDSVVCAVVSWPSCQAGSVLVGKSVGVPLRLCRPRPAWFALGMVGCESMVEGKEAEVLGLRGTTYPSELTCGKPSIASGIPSADMWGYGVVDTLDAGGAVGMEWRWDPVESVVVDVRSVES